MQACLPPNERERLAALASYDILDTPPEPDFDAITRLVAQICDVPFAVINLVAEQRQFFKSEVGLGVRETPMATSICAHALLQPGLFVIQDLTADERFSDNPLVTAGPSSTFVSTARWQGTIASRRWWPTTYAPRSRCSRSERRSSPSTRIASWRRSLTE